MADSTIKPDSGNDLVLQNNGGSKKIEITDSGNIEVTGAVDLQGNELILDADGDTSITADTDDQIDLKVGGSDKVSITASAVDINGNELILDADADTSITADTDDQIDFKTGGSDRLRIDSSGNVIVNTGKIGVNVGSPTGKIHVQHGATGISGSDDDVLTLEKDAETVTINMISDTDKKSNIIFSDTTRAQGRVQFDQNIRELSFWTSDSSAQLSINSSGNLIHNGLTTYTNAFAQGLSTTTNFDVTVPDSAQMFLLNAWHGYYPGSEYYANIFGVYAYRSFDTALGQLKDYFTHSHSNSGSFSVSITSGTNIRVTKTGGASGSYARGCIQLIFNES